MFLGRGFAHLNIGPVYVGDLILLLGVAAAAFVAIRARVRAPVTWTVALLIAFAALGALRTLPYLGPFGLDALRDGVLWGYAAFALIVYLLADRRLVLSAFRYMAGSCLSSRCGSRSPGTCSPQPAQVSTRAGRAR